MLSLLLLFLLVPGPLWMSLAMMSLLFIPPATSEASRSAPPMHWGLSALAEALLERRWTAVCV